jgi:hypothetical protein
VVACLALLRVFHDTNVIGCPLLVLSFWPFWPFVFFVFHLESTEKQGMRGKRVIGGNASIGWLKKRPGFPWDDTITNTTMASELSSVTVVS